VTIVGEAGAGKTRVAQRFAKAHARGFVHAGGVWFVELRGAADVESARLRIASALGIAGEGRFTGGFGSAAIGRAAQMLGYALLVLDNAEHLLPKIGDEILALLDAAPRLHVLVTSRAALGVLGEDVLDLGPLRLDGASFDGAESEAVDLFLTRVRSRRAEGGRSTSFDRAAISSFVKKVGGLPLTLELCAATFATDHDELARSSSMLATKGAASALAAQSPAAWALSLLAPPLHDVLLQCSVFRGSFDLDAAEAVIALGGKYGRESPVVLLNELVTRSLVQEDPDTGRFSLCEGMRSLAERALESSAKAVAVRMRHAELFAELAADHDPESGSLEVVRDDLEAALSFATLAERSDLVIVLTIGLDAISAGSGLTARQLAALDEALERAPRDARLVGRALGVRASALRGLGRMEEAAKDALVALRLAREAGDERQAVEMLHAVATAKFQLGDLRGALEHLRTAVFEARALGFGSLEGQALQQTGSVRASMGDTEEARTHYEAALGLAVRHRDELGEMRACAGLGSFHLELGEYDAAEEHYERALAIAERCGAKRTHRIVLGYLGILYFHAGVLPEAERLLERAATACREVGDVRVEGIFEGMRGGVLAELDRVADAGRTFDLADALLEPSPFFRQVIRIVRGHLDLAQARVARASGFRDAERAHVRAARYRILASRAPGRDDEAPIIARSDDARMAVALLSRAIDRYEQG
jgi:predicted ATPase